MKNSFKFIYLIVFVIIVIIVVSLGLFIMKSSQNFVDSSNLSLSDTSEFNNLWLVYSGKQSGSDIKILLKKLATNAEENKNNPAMLPDLAYKIHASDDFEFIYSTKKLNHSDSMRDLMAKIYLKHYYTVDFVYTADKTQIIGIIIKYNQKDKVDFVPDQT